MFDFFNKLIKQIKQVFPRLSLNQKIVIFVVIFVVIFSLFYLVEFSSKIEKVLLYSDGLEKADFKRAKSKLSKLSISYTTSDGRFIYVDSEEIAVKARAQLGIEGVIRDVNGFELFNNPKFSMTDFERRINLRRAITGSLVRHLESLDDIDKAEITISYGDSVKSIYRRDSENNPLTASVSIKPAPFSDIHENKNKIRGLRDFISKGIDRLKPENVIIMEKLSGVVLTDKIDSDDDDASIVRAKDQLKIKEAIRLSKIKELRSLLSMFPQDRYQLSVDLDINWDIKNTVIKGIEPVVLKNPHDPFDKGIVSDGVVISEQEVSENFDGPSYIPEGPAGVEPNVAPGAKELIDRYTKYRRTTKTRNKEIATKIQEKKNQPYNILGFNVAVVIDGTWVKVRDSEGNIEIDKNGAIKRKYTEVSNSEIARLKKLVQAAFSKKRGDKVELKHFQFDRTKEFEQEDILFYEEMRKKNIIYYVIISVFSIILFLVLFFLIRRHMLRRRRLKEEQFAQDQQAMREASLLSAEDNGVSLDIPHEDRARLEVQDNVINIARERSEDVAQILRTWISDES